MSFYPILRELFAGLDCEITIEEDGGDVFTGPVAEAAAFADKCKDPWVDLVTSDGMAIGVFMPGDFRKARLAPSINLPEGMVYFFSNEPSLGHPRGEHWLSLIDLVDFLGTDDPKVLDKIAWYDVSQVMAILNPSDRKICLMRGKSRQERQGSWRAIKSSMSDFLDSLMVHQDGKKDGPCFLQGESAGGVRKAVAMIENHIIGVDLDSGAPLEEVRAKIEAEGLECVIYTTHSHMKNTSVVTRDDYFKKMDTGDIDEESIRDYLIAHKGILPEIVEEIEILDEAKHTPEGIVILVQHKPMPKFRAVFPLSEPYTFAKRGGSQKDAIKDWKEVYAGFCTKLGLFFDPTCCDPARLFYLPRSPMGQERGAWKIEGDPVDLDNYDRVKLNRRRGKGPENAFTKAAGDVGDDDRDYRSLVTECGFDVLKWAKKKARSFEIEDCLRDVAPDVIRDDRGTNPGVHIECPFEAEHTAEGGLGTFVVNASDNYDEGYDGGFTIKCVHNACYDRDRLDFLKEMIDAGIITPEDLKNPDYYMDVEEEEEDDEVEEDDDDRPQKPKKPKSDDADWGFDEVSMMEGFNERYAIVRTSGGVKVLVEPRFPGDQVRFETQADVALYEKRRVLFYEGAKGKTQKVEAFKAWLEWEGRRTYRTAVFDPGKDVADDVYNLWQGWSHDPIKTVHWKHPMDHSEEPIKGDWSILRGHIYKNICEENDKWFEWFMTWLAHIFQKPQAKPGSTVVITGEKGVGKSTLFDYVNKLLGASGITVSQRKQIIGQFNGHLETTLLMVCEEAFWAADPQAEGVLKDMITNGSMLIERKGLDPIQARNYTRLALISNSDWVVPASLNDERRFGVFRCHSTRRGDLDYFENMRHQMDHLGGINAMLYDLLNWEPIDGSFNALFTPPQTEYLRQQQIESLSGMEKFMLELMKTGLYEAADDQRGFETIELSESQPTQVWGIELRNAAIDYMKWRGASDRFKLGLDDICPVAEEWFNAHDTKAVVRGGKNHRRMLVFPPLGEAREHLRETKGLDVEVMDPEVIEIKIPE